ncbi:DUF551 domain-containing protein [Pseudescherichia sp.]|uniref:DUF551 domain-containing protein n=1 Tax=Pseudescherichia sp. TaxID=2055881 RepID=UPI0028AC6678|nr:DUF551 domain-containing protein [Pseudescherichia sp.]
MSEFDSKALDLAREVMGLIRQEHIGGDAQLIAKIQLLFVEAMEYASPQLFGNAEQLNYPVTPDGWIKCSERLPACDGNYWGWWSESKRQGPVWFIKSELQAQFQSSEITHWQPLPAAPKQESL